MKCSEHPRVFLIVLVAGLTARTHSVWGCLLSLVLQLLDQVGPLAALGKSLLVDYKLLLVGVLLNLLSGQAVYVWRSGLLLRVLWLALAWVRTLGSLAVLSLVAVELVLELVDKVLLVCGLHSARARVQDCLPIYHEVQVVSKVSATAEYLHVFASFTAQSWTVYFQRVCIVI